MQREDKALSSLVGADHYGAFLRKKAVFLHKKQHFYNRLICKKAAFLQKYIFVKKQCFYNQVTCKKAAFLRKKAAFLQPLNL